MAAVIGGAAVFVFVFAVWSIVVELAVPTLEFVIAFSVQPLSIPYVSEVILWSQSCALLVAVIVRIVKGINENILGRGGDRHEGLGEWFFKSIIAIAGVALMPLFCSMIVQVGSWMYADVQGGISMDSITTSFSTVTESDVEGVVGMGTAMLAHVFVNSLLVLIAVGTCIKIAYDLLKRQIIMLVVSVTATWVSVKAATDSADEYFDLLVSLFGLCLTQWVQYLFLMVALSMFADMADASVGWLNMDLSTVEAIRSALFTLAAFGAATAVPAVIERYAFSTGRGGMGGMLVGMALRGGIRSMGGVVSGAAKFGQTAGKGLGGKGPKG